ncbi:hypothetical protein C8N35_1011139 [Breoghania corrubedonensis]|uniref:Uncharacterized protein n=1 Tax=Breoghania corrubedonensis TaxID=665038 RepID=A0A2T5VH57_9HYPH|nr:hypothetical protein [Breoghania corrubedonensis]PTW63089.1 hypothetical protein C8N35_1011139 [Breoghania corrubedonensis]
MVTRDVDRLERLPHAEINLTVTTTDDAISRWLEVRTPSATRRLHAFSQRHEEGIRTFAFVGLRYRISPRCRIFSTRSLPDWPGPNTWQAGL